MDLLALFRSYKPALVRVTVQTPAGDLSTGTAFHIGDGWLITAAHVLRESVLQELVSEQFSQTLTVQTVIFNKDDRIDLAQIKTDMDLSNYLHKTTIYGSPEGRVQTDHIEIGGAPGRLARRRVGAVESATYGISTHSVLSAPRSPGIWGEINAVVDKYNGPHPHFIISCPAKGEFSGGPVLK
ncbi:trypsin-like peptidase domain-containing protein [Stenotrophomonas rhizophila]|uniref:trypsin-like peptidase domain-containing protein n=1 Tax=Stenotrophomonas rhizophila TaxID=216778 RepID=UPI0015E83692|nr:trypsin-like peptidase domain-containing protein [Stenotrophomonas rhizophila]